MFTNPDGGAITQIYIDTSIYICGPLPLTRNDDPNKQKVKQAITSLQGMAEQRFSNAYN